MTNIRRYFRSNETAFLTSVTYKRLPILIDNFELLRDSFKHHLFRINAELVAWVVLPDHFHMLLSSNGDDISNLMRKIKLSFSSQYRKSMQLKSGRIWQYRYWDHIIRNQNDYNRHIDYIHYNPVKHGYVSSPIDWGHSSFREFLNEGYYSEGWGVKEGLNFDGEFGE